MTIKIATMMKKQIHLYDDRCQYRLAMTHNDKTDRFALADRADLTAF